MPSDLTFNAEAPIGICVPILILLRGAFVDDVPCVLRVCADLKPMRTKVTFASELKDRSAVVIAYFPLLGIVANALTNVSLAPSTPNVER